MKKLFYLMMGIINLNSSEKQEIPNDLINNLIKEFESRFNNLYRLLDTNEVIVFNKNDNSEYTLPFNNRLEAVDFILEEQEKKANEFGKITKIFDEISTLFQRSK